MIVGVLLGSTSAETAWPAALHESGAARVPSVAEESEVASTLYKATVFGRIRAVNHLGDKMKGVPGAAGIHFAVGADGSLMEVRVVRPSGHRAFDASALAMVRRAAPFPAPPLGAKRDFDVTIKFDAARRR